MAPFFMPAPVQLAPPLQGRQHADQEKLTHFHFCCGLGGGAKGFNRAKPIVGNMQAEWECLGGVDVDPAGLADFKRLSGVDGTLIDLFTRDQYTRFHGKEPPAGWVEAGPDDIRRAAQYRRPDAVFISSPARAPAVCSRRR